MPTPRTHNAPVYTESQQNEAIYSRIIGDSTNVPPMDRRIALPELCQIGANMTRNDEMTRK